MYIAMLVLQLSGAIILLFNNIVGTKKRVIKNCFSGSNYIERDVDNNCIIEKRRLRRSASRIYINIIAFVNLVVGYSVAALNPQINDAGGQVVCIVIIVALVLSITEIGACFFASVLLYAKDLKVPYSELECIDISTNLIPSEIEEILNREIDDKE